MCADPLLVECFSPLEVGATLIIRLVRPLGQLFPPLISISSFQPSSLCWNFRTIFGVYRNRVGIGLSYRPASAGILDQSLGARNRVGIGLSYRLASAGILEQSLGPRNRAWIGLSYRSASAGILEQYLGARNRVGIRLSYRTARLHIGYRSWFLGSLKV